MVIPKKLPVGSTSRSAMFKNSSALGNCSRQLNLYQSDFLINFETGSNLPCLEHFPEAENVLTRPVLRSMSPQQRTMPNQIRFVEFCNLVMQTYSSSIHSIRFFCLNRFSCVLKKDLLCLLFFHGNQKRKYRTRNSRKLGFNEKLEHV